MSEVPLKRGGRKPVAPPCRLTASTLILKHAILKGCVSKKFVTRLDHTRKSKALVWKFPCKDIRFLKKNEMRLGLSVWSPRPNMPLSGKGRAARSAWACSGMRTGTQPRALKGGAPSQPQCLPTHCTSVHRGPTSSHAHTRWRGSTLPRSRHSTLRRGWGAVH